MTEKISSGLFFQTSKYIMNTIDRYFKEFIYLKTYVISVFLVLIGSYSVFLFFNDDVAADLGREDHFFEWMTAIYLFVSGVILFIYFLKTRNYFILFLSIILFFGSGEEISWGQRLIGFETPASIKEKNVQWEFNFHNLETFSGVDSQHRMKKGFERLFEMNFLFRLFTMLWGIVLPILTYHIKFVNQITLKLKIPVPPISVGIFFFINWVTYWFMHTHLHKVDLEDASTEIFESIGAFIIFVMCIYFFATINKIKMGNDIKESFQ